ncbi:MAG TPA: hypothetical protein VFW65_18590 [Pseudonocardiaceae bacterium]|nr:hypothetical protein [Pseudonocardiaceae bacterium]
MRKHVRRVVLAGGATAAAVALMTGQAFAADTVTITGADTSFTAESSAIVFDDLTSGQAFQCTHSTISGSLADATTAPSPFTTTQAGGSPHSITGLGFSGCILSLGAITTTVPAADLPDDLVITTTGTTAPQAGGHLQAAGSPGLLVHFSVVTCSFDLQGNPDMTWTNGTTHQLTFTGTSTTAQLTPVHPSAGCFGLFSSGDRMAYEATYTVSLSTVTVTP